MKHVKIYDKRISGKQGHLSTYIVLLLSVFTCHCLTVFTYKFYYRYDHILIDGILEALVSKIHANRHQIFNYYIIFLFLLRLTINESKVRPFNKIFINVNSLMK